MLLNSGVQKKLIFIIPTLSRLYSPVLRRLFRNLENRGVDFDGNLMRHCAHLIPLFIVFCSQEVQEALHRMDFRLFQ